MLEATRDIVRRMSEHLGLSEQELEMILKADATHKFEISLNSGKVLKAYRIQHSNRLGPYKGGIRFHPAVDEDDVAALAILMSLKTAAVGLPMGGGKGGIRFNPKDHSQEEIEEIARKYVSHLHEHIGPEKDVPAPDVNTNAEIIDWMVDEYSKHSSDETKASFTGKSLENGGSHGREAATGLGGVVALQKYIELSGRSDNDMTIAVQGAGNVASFFGTIGADQRKDWRLVAVTDSSGGVLDSRGLKMKDIIKFKKAGSRLIDMDPTHTIEGNDIVAADVDVLVLAALGDAITKENMEQVKAGIVLELANGPIDKDAHKYLTERGVVIIPDVVANAGGVIVSYLEWCQNRKRESWSEEKVNKKLTEYMERAVAQAYDYAEAQNISLKEAAVALAIERILKGSN